MAATFVKIPFGSRLRYPGECPFTGRKNPKAMVKIRRRDRQMFLPIPFIGWIKLGKIGRTAFPATRAFALVAGVLAVLPSVSVIAGFGGLLWTKGRPNAVYWILGGVGIMYLCRALEWFWLCRVRIVRTGMSSLEVRFASQKYAEEFCRLNELRFHPKQTSKGATPIILNNIR
jgi:hypothetical protein